MGTVALHRRLDSPDSIWSILLAQLKLRFPISVVWLMFHFLAFIEVKTWQTTLLKAGESPIAKLFYQKEKDRTVVSSSSTLDK